MSLLRGQIFSKFWNQFESLLSSIAKVAMEIRKEKSEEEKRGERAMGNVPSQVRKWPMAQLLFPPKLVRSLSFHWLTSGPHQRRHRLHHRFFPKFFGGGNRFQENLSRLI
jgi:hypothetical protein